jgi:hypothetical protein
MKVLLSIFTSKGFENAMLVMASIILVTSLILAVRAANADTLVSDDGATCEAPEGYNYAPYSDTNILGMDPEQFCRFPLFEFVAGQVVVPVEIPECEDGLVIGPGQPVYPCYRIDEGPQ